LENATSRLSSEIESLNAYKASLVEMHKNSGVANWENGAETQEIQAQIEQSINEWLTLKRQKKILEEYSDEEQGPCPDTYASLMRACREDTKTKRKRWSGQHERIFKKAVMERYNASIKESRSSWCHLLDQCAE